METEPTKKANVKVEADEITNDYVRIVQNTCNMISYISANLNGLPFDEIPNAPNFAKFKFGEINYVGNKRLYLDMWIYNHGLNDIIKGINLSLGRANYLAELMTLHGVTMSVEDYYEFEKQINKKYLKKDLPTLINLTSNLVTKPLILIPEIKTINSVRKCLEHRTGQVTQIDANYESDGQSCLKLEWLGQVLKTIRNGEEIIVDKPGFEFKKGEIISAVEVKKEKIFLIGDRILLSLDEFFQLAYTGYRFVKHVADNFEIEKNKTAHNRVDGREP